jgi:hypothetical protein
VVRVGESRKRKQWEINFRWGVMDQTEDKESMINKEFIGDDVDFGRGRALKDSYFFLVYIGCHRGLDKVPEEVG